MKKTILPLCAALLVTAGLASCGTTEQTSSSSSKDDAKKTVTLSVWVPTEQIDWAKERIEKFKKANENTDYRINVSAVSEGKVYEEIKKEPTGAADVFFYAGDNLGPLMDGGYLYAFSDSIYQSLQGQMSEATLNSGVVDGKLYGISYTPNSYFMYYDSSKVTAEEAKDLDKVLSKGKVIFDIDNGYYQTAFWYGTGVRFFGPDGKDPTTANLNSREGKIAAKAIRNYIMNDNFINGGDDDIKSKFTKDNNSKVVAAIGGSWLSSDLITTFGNDLMATTLPTFHEGDKQYYLTATGDWKKCGISKYVTASAAIEAQKLALWLTNKEASLEKFEAFNEAPTLTEVATLPEVQNNMVIKALMEQTNGEHIVLQPSISQMSNWWDAATAYAKDILSAKNSSSEFTDEQCEKWADDLQDMLLTKVTK